MKKAIVTGISGQDGSYLAELLLSKNYKVYGLIRRSSSNSLGNSSHLASLISIDEFDLLDASSISRLVSSIQPDEFYNLAAQSHVATSYAQPSYTFSVNTLGVLNCLEAIRSSSTSTKFYQASSSEMYGTWSKSACRDFGFNEKCRFNPQSPYAVSKVAAHNLVSLYRKSYNLFACSGILFNHESPRRGPNFVTRKITLAASRIKLGLQDKLSLGNLSATRDFGHAKDYVDGIHKMLQYSTPDDYVLSSNEFHSIKEVCEVAFSRLDLDYTKYVISEDIHKRPYDVECLLGDSTKARARLLWKPTYNFISLIQDMVDADYSAIKPKAKS